jgi:hypothetical protein
LEIPELLRVLETIGIFLYRDGDSLGLTGKTRSLSEEVMATLRTHKPALLPRLNSEKVSPLTLLPAPPPVEEPAAESEQSPIEDPTLKEQPAAPAPLVLDADGLAGVTIADRHFLFRPRWAGERLAPTDNLLSLDTETEVVEDPARVPALALATAGAGANDSCIIHPDYLGAFVLAHRDLHFACHNSSFDFWVVEQHLRQRGEEEALRAVKGREPLRG